MNITPKKRLIIIAAIVGFFIIPITIAIIYRSYTHTDQKITEKTDPITGETVVDGGTTPERAQPGTDRPITGPVVMGSSNIAELYGSSVAYDALNNLFLKRIFKDAKLVKISQRAIIKHVTVNQQTGQVFIAVNFDVYLNNNTTDKYTIETNYNQNDSIIDITMTDHKGEKQTHQINIYGGD